MKYKYDQEADAIYIHINAKPYAYGKDLDEERRIDYASDSTPIGVELLNVSKGVKLDGLPCLNEVADMLVSEGIKFYLTQYSYYMTITGSPNDYYRKPFNTFEVRLASPAMIERDKHSVGIKEEVTV
ncbi:MAG: DUF2283 domain-containing protein [Chloroflexota bacterium]|nr:DUF2283 domain-containing protein [Chloroflexota bacterium]